MIEQGLVLQNRYRVIRQLGRGGIGETWEVDDGGTPKVMKVLLDNYPKVVELFKREAEVLMQLNHPGIPKVEPDGYFSFPLEGTTEPLHCMVMEFIEGQNLEQWLEAQGNKPISQEQALAWLKQLVEILAQVHDQKHFHRDIKPYNIMRRPDGQLVLIDFGTVREITSTYIEKLERRDVTRIYSFSYTAPEQLRGQACPQSDFFALGRTFVYLLTGKVPTDFQEDPDTFQLKKNWRDSAPQVSKPLADLIDDLMAPSPLARPQNAQDILQRLAILEIELSIEPILKELPRPIRFLARQIQEHSYQQWVKQTRIPTIALYGRTNSGKSSLINAIMGKFVARVGTGAEPTTPDNDSYECERNGYKLQFIDSRGVGELSTGESSPEEAFQQAIDYIVKRKIDILLFVVLATEVGYSDEDVKFLKTLKEAHQKAHKANLPIILVINKIDNATPSSEWSPPYNLSLDSGDSSRKPRTARDAKEANIRNCIEKRSIQYKYLTHAYVPVCTCWNNYEDKRYNIDELELQIYNLIPDEAAKEGFGKGTADKRLKKAVASRFTSAAAWLAFALFAVLPGRLDTKAVLSIQTNLVITIAKIAGIHEEKDRRYENLLKQLGVQQTDSRAAMYITLAIGKAAIFYFIDKEKIIHVKQIYDRECKRLEPEFREAFQGGKTEVFNLLKEINAELHEQYGVKRIYEEDGNNNINPVMQSPL